MKNNCKMWFERASMLALLLLLTAVMDASAQRKPQRENDQKRNANYGGSYLLQKTATDAGYNEGIKEGRTDRSRGERFDFKDENSYQSAIKNYNSRLGNKSVYQRYFRDAFGKGYREGWNGY